MDLHLDEDIIKQLEHLAEKQQRDIAALVADAVRDYLQGQAEEEQLRSETQGIIHDHQWLLDELAK